MSELHPTDLPTPTPNEKAMLIFNTLPEALLKTDGPTAGSWIVNDWHVSVRGIGYDDVRVVLSTKSPDEMEDLTQVAKTLAELLVSEITNNDACDLLIRETYYARESRLETIVHVLDSMT
jgi:hypothetical protein